MSWPPSCTIATVLCQLQARRVLFWKRNACLTHSLGLGKNPPNMSVTLCSPLRAHHPGLCTWKASCQAWLLKHTTCLAFLPRLHKSLPPALHTSCCWAWSSSGWVRSDRSLASCWLTWLLWPSHLASLHAWVTLFIDLVVATGPFSPRCWGHTPRCSPNTSKPGAKSR